MNEDGYFQQHNFQNLCGSERDATIDESKTTADIPDVSAKGGRLCPRLESIIQKAHGGGQPLEGEIQARMTHCLGYDFKGVRIHTGLEADELNRRLDSSAFTIGSDIFFAHNTYNPNTTEGRELITHELIHVMQQGSAHASDAAFRLTVGPADDALEGEAESLAQLVNASNARRHGCMPQVRLRTTRPGTIQRRLRDTCMTAPPKIISCHATTMWWIYKEKHGATADWHTFLHGDHDVSELLAGLIQEYGRERSKWFTMGVITVNQGSVVVFAEGKLRTDMVSGHSCVCGNDGRLHGSSQAGCFDCSHGKIGMCDHAPSEINWTKMSEVDNKYKVYSVEEADAMKWADKNL